MAKAIVRAPVQGRRKKAKPAVKRHPAGPGATGPADLRPALLSVLQGESAHTSALDECGAVPRSAGREEGRGEVLAHIPTESQHGVPYGIDLMLPEALIADLSAAQARLLVAAKENLLEDLLLGIETAGDLLWHIGAYGQAREVGQDSLRTTGLLIRMLARLAQAVDGVGEAAAFRVNRRGVC